MACGCSKNRRAGGRTASGAEVLGYEVTYPDGSKAPGLFLTPLEAKKEARLYGQGSTIREITSGG